MDANTIINNIDSIINNNYNMKTKNFLYKIKTHIEKIEKKYVKKLMLFLSLIIVKKK